MKEHEFWKERRGLEKMPSHACDFSHKLDGHHLLST